MRAEKKINKPKKGEERRELRGETMGIAGNWAS